jgi:ABC-2 type transport system ATP-binding protein/lipopolysaccharide transport system ATP-binding protein
MDNNNAIYLNDVSVIYRVPKERLSGIKEFAIRWMQRRLDYEEFWALKDLSIQIKRGEVFGVIGRNGSGKSTLLKVIARVLIPTQGRVITRGRVAPLLELGAGFQQELTGRENIYLNSALLGRSQKQTEALLPDIIEFAEIDEFIDAPIRTYSTGMQARLGFSVATCVRPDILLVDEVLSVGDAQFQVKCIDRMNAYREQGTTIILVSHSMATIQTFCDQAMWLDSGVTQATGPVDEVINHYIDMDRTERYRQAFSQEEPVPVLDTAQIEANIQDFTPLENIGEIYPTDDIFNINQGTVSVWLKFLIDRPHPDTIIFQTEDSRFVVYITRWNLLDKGEFIPVIVARAGGNRRVLNTYFGTSSFPEASAAIDNSGHLQGIPYPEDEWHLVSMTWTGYLNGTIRLYVDSSVIAETTYDERSDDGRDLAKNFSVGMRPISWTGELVQKEDGTLDESRPISTMSVTEGGIEIKDLRLYQRALTDEEIRAINEGG